LFISSVQETNPYWVPTVLDTGETVLNVAGDSLGHW
jgi:hypothetical protein